MAKGFQKFRRESVKTEGQPFIALHKRGIFSLSDPAYNLLGRPEAIELLYNEDERAIGFQAAKKSDADAFSVRHHTKFAHQVEGRSFLRFYEVPEEARGRRYHAELVDDILTINLQQESEDGEESAAGGGA